MNTRQIIPVLSFIGFLISLYLAVLSIGSAEGDAFCDINEFWSCATVYESSYSTFFGIPVALIGMIGFVLIGILSFGGNKYVRYLRILALMGLLFMLYLMWAEFFVLRAACLYCVIVFAIMAAIFGLVVRDYGVKT